MKPIKILSAADQLARAMGEEIFQGNLSGEIPGVKSIAASCGLNHKTVEVALKLLEQQGLLVSQGVGRRRRVQVKDEDIHRRGLRIGILPYDKLDEYQHYIVELRYRLLELGHSVEITSKCQIDLRLDAKKTWQYVKSYSVEAWIVVAGSHELLKIFHEQKLPCFALFGTTKHLPIPIAGPQKNESLRMVTQKLLSLGHRRIILMFREEHLKPRASPAVELFIEVLEAHGVAVGRYHVPHWENSPAGFQKCLEATFAATPPTAILVDEACLYHAVQHFLADRKLLVPEEVSLVCLSPDPAFEWCHPQVTHLAYDSDPWIRQIVQWVNELSRGNNKVQKSLTVPEFIEGGTIGPVSDS